MLSNDRKRIYSKNKKAANYRDRRRPSATTPEHHPNIYINLDPHIASRCPIPLTPMKYEQWDERMFIRVVKKLNFSCCKREERGILTLTCCVDWRSSSQGRGGGAPADSLGDVSTIFLLIQATSKQREKVKYGGRSPKFILAPCHVMCTAVFIGWDPAIPPLL
jgi:hypothetical protein